MTQTASFYEITKDDQAILDGLRVYGPQFDSGYCDECGRRSVVRCWKTVEVKHVAGGDHVMRGWHFQCQSCQG